MFLAHLPAGYLCSHALLALSRVKPKNLGTFIALGMLGSVAPDVDLIWHGYFANKPIFHHYYWTHYPFAWAVPSALALLMSLALGQRMWALGILIFCSNGMLHLVLDTVWGSIGWAWPFDKTLFKWVSVPHNHRFWVWNFVLHWTAFIELAIIAAAAALWVYRHAAKTPSLRLKATMLE